MSEEPSKALGDTGAVDIQWVISVISLSITETNVFDQVIPALILVVLN